MRFLPTKFESAWLIEPERHEDERGFFARTWCQREFEQHGLDPNLVQCSVSFNHNEGTLRGMHFQAAPHEEAKLVRCTQGSIFDVVVDDFGSTGMNQSLSVREPVNFVALGINDFNDFVKFMETKYGEQKFQGGYTIVK